MIQLFKSLEKKELLGRFRSLFGLLFLVALASLLSPRFLTGPNILNVLRQTSINAIVAAGMTLVILTGGIDLSVGSIMAFSGALGALSALRGFGFIGALSVALVSGILAGTLTGIIIAKGKVQPFIVTLASMTLLRGGTLLLSDGRPITLLTSDMPPILDWLGNGRFLTIPIPVILVIGLFMILTYGLKNTPYGRHVYALGGNEEASLLSGLRTDRIKISVYALSGGLSALAGMVLMSRLSSAQPTAGTGYELDAIAAVVLGGTSLAGGFGGIAGTLVGALIIGVLNNSLNLLNVSSYYQMIAKGLVILLAVLLDRKNNKK